MSALDVRPAVRVHGPYPDSVALANDAEHVYRAARHTADPMRVMEQIDEGLILGALREAHVELGARERSVAALLAELQPEYVAVLVGWIERAAVANHGVLLAEVARHRAVLTEVGLAMTRCCGWECVQTAALPAGSTFLCAEHGGCDAAIKTAGSGR